MLKKSVAISKRDSYIYPEKKQSIDQVQNIQNIFGKINYQKKILFMIK